MGVPKTASVIITNNLGAGLAGLTLEHIYSSHAPETIHTGNMDVNETRNIGVVNFETGFGTGLDWWKLSWTDVNGSIYTSDKTFFSKMCAYFAKYAPDMLAVASSSINVWSLITNRDRWISSVINFAAVAYNLGTRDTVSTMDRLKDYKEFMLEKEDVDIRFTINQDNTISIQANSGQSEAFKYYKQEVRLPDVRIALNMAP